MGHTPQLIIIVIFVVVVLGTFIALMIGFSGWIREEVKNRHNSIRPALTWSVIGVSCVASIGALIASLYTWHFIRIAEMTTGTVIEMVPQDNADSHAITYAPTFRFQGTHGETHTVASHFSSSPPAFHVGENVKVLYLPDDPQRARIDTYLQTWGLPTLLGILGGFGLSIGLFILFWPAILARFRTQSARQNSSNHFSGSE